MRACRRAAAIAGVSVRTLFLGFQRYRGVSPMRLLRELRLQRVRDELLRAEADARVGHIALRWGFHHLGRFGQEYREAFGESPRQTLLQRRRGWRRRSAGGTQRSPHAAFSDWRSGLTIVGSSNVRSPR
jgi:transcriptional regulator GlxA family with amidase domain